MILYIAHQDKEQNMVFITNKLFYIYIINLFKLLFHPNLVLLNYSIFLSMFQILQKALSELVSFAYIDIYPYNYNVIH